MLNRVTNVYKQSTAYGQTIKIKRICSTGENLGICLGQLMQWLVTWDYKQDQVESKDFIQ